MKGYYNKAKDYLTLSRSTYTRDYKYLKQQALEEHRTAFEFCIWYDYQLVGKANLETGVFSCILDLIDNKHISAAYIKDFRLACILFQKFLQSDKTINNNKCAEYLADHPDIAVRLNTKRVNANFGEYLKYDREKAHKIIFPFFRSRGIDINLIGELISRELLAFDTTFRNLIFLNTNHLEIVGVEKLGIGEEHFQRLEGKKPLCWCYWMEQKKHIQFQTDIESVIFFDTTLHLLKYLSDHEPQENTLYCSLHTENCLLETFINTIALLKKDVEIKFVFEVESKTERFKNVKKTNDITPDIKKENTIAVPTLVQADNEEIPKTAAELAKMESFTDEYGYLCYRDEQGNEYEQDGTARMPF